MASTPGRSGYWLANSGGGLAGCDSAEAYGDLAGTHLAEPVVGIAATPTGGGYGRWRLELEGGRRRGIFASGDARFCGSGG